MVRLHLLFQVQRRVATVDRGGIGERAIVADVCEQSRRQAPPLNGGSVGQVHAGRHVRIHIGHISNLQDAIHRQQYPVLKIEIEQAGEVTGHVITGSQRNAVESDAAQGGGQLLHPHRQLVLKVIAVGRAGTNISDGDSIGHPLAGADGVAGRRLAGFDQEQLRLHHRESRLVAGGHTGGVGERRQVSDHIPRYGAKWIGEDRRDGNEALFAMGDGRVSDSEGVARCHHGAIRPGGDGVQLQACIQLVCDVHIVKRGGDLRRRDDEDVSDDVTQGGGGRSDALEDGRVYCPMPDAIRAVSVLPLVGDVGAGAVARLRVVVRDGGRIGQEQVGANGVGHLGDKGNNRHARLTTIPISAPQNTQLPGEQPRGIDGRRSKESNRGRRAADQRGAQVSEAGRQRIAKDDVVSRTVAAVGDSQRVGDPVAGAHGRTAGWLAFLIQGQLRLDNRIGHGGAAHQRSPVDQGDSIGNRMERAPGEDRRQRIYCQADYLADETEGDDCGRLLNAGDRLGESPGEHLRTVERAAGPRGESDVDP